MHNITKQRLIQNPNKQCEIHKAMDQQQQNHCLRTDSSLSLNAKSIYLFISKCIKLSVYSFLLVRKYTSILVHVIYFKIDQTNFFRIGKTANMFIDLCYLFQN